MRLAEEERIQAGWVRGVGSLVWIDIALHEQATRELGSRRRFRSPSELLTLEGAIARRGSSVDISLFATVARQTDNGIDLLGGRLAAAEVFACELSIEVYEDLQLSRTVDEETGLSPWRGTEREGVVAQSAKGAPSVAEKVAAVSKQWTSEPEPVPDEPAADDGPVSWAQVAAASAHPASAPGEAKISRTRRSPKAPAVASSSKAKDFVPPPIPDRKNSQPAFLDEPVVGKGDWVDHRQFGVCRVDREDEDGGLVIRLPNGRRKTIKLDFMEVEEPRIDGDRRIYPIRPRRSR